MEKKVCKECNQEKVLSEFVKDKQCVDGYRNTCKECANFKRRKNKDYIKSNMWSKEEINILKENYPYNTILELKDLLSNRSKSAIENKAVELKLKKYKTECKEGYQICKKCGRELPWTYQYFPVVRSEKNPRRICRECNPKYKTFLNGDSEMRIYWSKEDEQLFINRYPHYTNEELRNKFYKDLSDKQLTNKAWNLGVEKSEETYWRGRKQQAPKVSAKLKGLPKTEEHKRKVSETKKRQYAEGLYVSPWLGRVVSDEERKRLSERVKGKWVGKNNPRHIKPLFGKENGRWQGGITNISTALRENIYEWKQSSMELCKYKCIFTGGEFDNVHHLTPFNNIIKECLDELGLKPMSNLGQYSEHDRNNLIRLVQEKHKKYGLGLCMSKEIHKLFHDKYSYIDFTIENFKEFMQDYFNGKYDDILENKLKSVNSKMGFEEAKKLASFYYV